MTTPRGRGDAPIEAPQMPNASRTNPIPSHINVVADTPVWGSQPGSIAHISALSECIFCGTDHPEGVVHSDAEIRAYERGRAAARDEGRREAEAALIPFTLDYFLPLITRDFAGQEAQDRIDARMRASLALHRVAGLNASESADQTAASRSWARAEDVPGNYEAHPGAYEIDDGERVYRFSGDASESGQPQEGGS